MVMVNGTAANYHDPMPVRFIYKNIAEDTPNSPPSALSTENSSIEDTGASIFNIYWLVIAVVAAIAIVAGLFIMGKKQKSTPAEQTQPA
jgi:hypothetical protein